MSSVRNGAARGITGGFALCGIMLGSRDEADTEGLDRTNGTAGGLPMEVLQREFLVIDRLHKGE